VEVDDLNEEEVWENVVKVDEAIVSLVEGTESENIVEEVEEFQSMDSMEMMGHVTDDVDELKEEQDEEKNFDEGVPEEANEQKIAKVLEERDESLNTSEIQIYPKGSLQ
jgi:hypothetical protein